MARGNPVGRSSRRWWVLGSGLVAAVVAVPVVGVAPARAATGSPCSSGAVACVALGNSGFNGKAWMLENGRVVRGPVDVSTGGPGEDTPTGTFNVISKDADHKSTQTTDTEGRPSAMPYSVFFTKSGVAFHGGEGERTAGCVRLPDADAKYFYDHLSVGDTVQVVTGAAEYDEPKRDEHEHHHGGGGGILGF